jgi:hypothetical protein
MWYAPASPNMPVYAPPPVSPPGPRKGTRPSQAREHSPVQLAPLGLHTAGTLGGTGAKTGGNHGKPLPRRLTKQKCRYNVDF